METLKIMDAREKKELLTKISDAYGIPPEIFSDYEFLEKPERIFITSRASLSINLRNLSIEGLGLSFARISGSIKLTTNAIQLFGRHATKNILDLDNENALKYIRGLDLSGLPAKDIFGYVIVRSGKDYLGSGLYKDGYLKNQIPKQRRIKKLGNMQ